MPSQTTNSRSASRSANSRPATSSSAATKATITKRQARAARRAYERQRRNRILTYILAVLVVAGLVALFVTHNPFAQAGHTSAHATASACPAPTATPVGPVPSIQPPKSPPLVKGTPVSDQGIQYIDVTVGCGPAVAAGNNVTVIYTGWLQSTGKMFDSSYLHGGTFPVQNVGQAQVISGWNIGLIGMKPGGTRRLIIPASLAYGAQGQPPTIPPNATLIFDITLVSIDS